MVMQLGVSEKRDDNLEERGLPDERGLESLTDPREFVVEIKTGKDGENLTRGIMRLKNHGFSVEDKIIDGGNSNSYSVRVVVSRQ